MLLEEAGEALLLDEDEESLVDAVEVLLPESLPLSDLLSDAVSDLPSDLLSDLLSVLPSALSEGLAFPPDFA